MSAAHGGRGEALAEALEYAAAGYVVGPVSIRLDERGKKVPTFHTRWEHPKEGEVSLSSDPAVIAEWARRHPGTGFHIPCGPNGIVIAEGDVKRNAKGELVADGRRSWRAARGPKTTMTVTTQGGGAHWYFRAPEGDPIHNSSKAVAGVPDVDVRGDGGTVFASGTHVHGGGIYVANRIVPRDALPELGAEWEAKLRAAGPVHRDRERPPSTPVAERRSRLVSASKVKDPEWIEAKIDDELRELGRPGVPDFRSRLFEASAIVYRAVALELVSEEEAEERLRAAVRRAWDAEPDRDDAAWIAEGRTAAEADPWLLPITAEALAAEQEANAGLSEVDEQGEPLTAEEIEERAVRREVDDLRRRRDAMRRLAAEDAPPLRWLTFGEFRTSPRPSPLVPGVFYRDTLSRIYGAPGCGKSFVAIDLACHVALGRPWRDEQLETSPVVYVMAEGQAVNVLRVEAWCERHKVDPDELEGRLFAVPDAVALTEEGVRGLAERVAEIGAGLVILDTKNAMMIGEENSATDTATMRRALDLLRKASGACVVLIDHTGHEGTRARGSTAATAAMDTELRVTKTDDRPALITAEVTRDKAAEAGAAWRWHLRMAAEAAALVPTELTPEDRLDGDLEWTEATVAVPTDLLHFEGAGKAAMPDLARYMASEASARDGDPSEVGASRADAERALAKRGHAKSTVRRAWSALLELERIEAANGVKAPTGRHVWAP